MKFRHATRAVAASAAAFAFAGLGALAVSGTAGATVGTASGDQNATAAATTTVTPGTPFSTGQIISVTVPANPLFDAGGINTGTNLEVAECAAPNGVLPTLASECQPDSLDGDTINPNTDGSVSYTNYTAWQLPNTLLGESASDTPVCGDTLATECTLYVGPNVTDFTQPHYFTQPFLVADNSGGFVANPGDGTPEAPLAIGLPLAGGVIVGGVLFRRRRIARSAS